MSRTWISNCVHFELKCCVFSRIYCRVLVRFQQNDRIDLQRADYVCKTTNPQYGGRGNVLSDFHFKKEEKDSGKSLMCKMCKNGTL